MKKMLRLLLCLMLVYSVLCVAQTGNSCTKIEQKMPLEDQRCDGQGYYFDRGGRRMFETSYGDYQRGSFNLRRGHLWEDRACKKHRCHRVHKSKASRCSVTERCPVSRYTESPKHEHYSAQGGLTRWPSAPGPDNQFGGTSAFPYIATPIWLRDTTGASGYATPTSWQGFQ